ncbi:MAG: LOG family protein [Ignavibacteria bacterium]|nr:LOG family protein [Ignavibacteria bacterium]
MTTDPTITVFGSSRPSPGEEEYTRAFELGRSLAEAGFTLCNGGYGGIMEASARGAREAGGRTIGIITAAFPRSANTWIDTVVVKESLIDRMLALIDTGDAYAVLKGGTGTLLELAAVWEFMNKQMLPSKPIIIVGNFWDGVVTTLRNELAWEGLADCTRYVQVVDSPPAAVRALQEHFRKRNERR